MSHAIPALLICAAFAGLEGALAGGGVRAHFAALRQPRYSPPLALWFVIGGVYYVICFVLLYRILGHPVALALLLALMLMNALWGWVFFRRKHLRASVLAFVPYLLIALGLARTLARADRLALLIFTPYLLYLVYATWWSHRIWMLNRERAE